MKACCDTPVGVRNKALITLLYRAGLRITEALKLQEKDLDPVARSIRVLHAKGGKSRTIGLDERGFSIIKLWLHYRSKLRPDPEAPVFCLLDARPMTSAYARVLLPRMGRRARIVKRVHPHGLRHTHATELRKEGLDIAIISKHLGHQSIATTAIYLDHIAPIDVIKAIANRKW